MLARFVLGAVAAGAVIVPALAGQMMNADEARKFVAGKVFAFTCFDGTRGAGRVLDDMGAAGAVQFSGAGPVRHVRLPGNTLRSFRAPAFSCPPPNSFLCIHTFERAVLIQFVHVAIDALMFALEETLHGVGKLGARQPVRR